MCLMLFIYRLLLHVSDVPYAVCYWAHWATCIQWPACVIDVWVAEWFWTVFACQSISLTPHQHRTQISSFTVLLRCHCACRHATANIRHPHMSVKTSSSADDTCMFWLCFQYTKVYEFAPADVTGDTGDFPRRSALISITRKRRRLLLMKSFFAVIT